MAEIPPTKPGMKIAFETITEPEVEEDAFLKVTEGVQDSTDTSKASAASRQAAVRLNEVHEFHEQRSRRSQLLDEEFEATVTTDVETWKSDPANYDFPGIDTPSDIEYDF